MQGYRISALMIFVVLQAFIGCKTQQQQSAPAPAAGVKAPAPKAVTDLPPILVTKPDAGADWETYRTAQSGDTVTWQSDYAFIVEFPSSDKNPCVEMKDTQNPDGYSTGQDEVAPRTYRTSCTIKDGNKGKRFKYKIDFVFPANHQAAKPQHKKRGGGATHCNGCIIEVTQ